LNDYFLKYKPFLLFLGKFILTYIGLTFMYQVYLGQFDTSTFEVDGISQVVANQSKIILEWFGYFIELKPNLSESSILFLFNSVCIIRIIEGCNAMSIMILFAAFVVSFSGNIMKTIGYIVIGIVLIHILNVFRIALLTIGLIHYPEKLSLLHDIIFPVIIYGFVFFLWVIWVNKFSKYAEK
jgi:exosortase family protein XrtF